VSTYDTERAANRRIWRRTSWVVGVALVVGGVFGALPFGHHHGGFLVVVATMLTFGGLAGMFSLFPSALGRSDELRLPLLGVERSRRRAIKRAALGRRGGDYASFSPEERRRALEYAQSFSLNQPLILTQSLLLFVGLIGTQLMTSDDSDFFFRLVHWFYLTVIPAFIVVITILTVMWIRGADNYAQTRAGDAAPLPDASAQP
jgi:hypothetical protein